MSKLVVWLATIAAALAILAGGCSTAKAAGNTTRPAASVPAIENHSLADTSWVLASYGDPANLKSIIAGSKITLSFNKTSDQISGNGGVNGYGGAAVRTDNQLTLTGILHTMMASTNQAVNEQENTYFQLLGSAINVDFGNSTLTINCDGGQVLMFSTSPANILTSSPTTCLATSVPVSPPPNFISPPASSSADGFTSITMSLPGTTAFPPHVPVAAIPA